MLLLFTLFHVALSLIGIVAGLAAALGWLHAKLCPKGTAIFLWTTAATVVTGFLFPFNGFTPAIGFGLILIPVMAVAFYAWYGRKLAGPWRGLYVVSALFSLYLNCFVLVVQAFLKVPALNALAPTQKEPPFAIAQGLTLLVFIALTVAAVIRFRPETPR